MELEDNFKSKQIRTLYAEGKDKDTSKNARFARKNMEN